MFYLLLCSMFVYIFGFEQGVVEYGVKQIKKEAEKGFRLNLVQLYIKSKPYIDRHGKENDKLFLSPLQTDQRLKSLTYVEVMEFLDDNQDFDERGHFLLGKDCWETIRLLWIGYSKNNTNDKCFISNLGEDLIKCIIIISFINLPIFLRHCIKSEGVQTDRTSNNDTVYVE